MPGSGCQRPSATGLARPVVLTVVLTKSSPEVQSAPLGSALETFSDPSVRSRSPSGLATRPPWAPRSMARGFRGRLSSFVAYRDQLIDVGKLDRVFVDTATLYPISLADLVLRLADLGMFELLWSDHLLAEVERVLVQHMGLAAEQAAYFCECIR
jgi:hypothetical protein